MRGMKRSDIDSSKIRENNARPAGAGMPALADTALRRHVGRAHRHGRADRRHPGAPRRRRRGGAHARAAGMIAEIGSATRNPLAPIGIAAGKLEAVATLGGA